MLIIAPILMLAFFALCLLVAGWPLLRLAAVRPALLGLTGSGCVLAGAIGAGLVASGLIGPGDFVTQVAAQEAASAEPPTADASTAEATAAETPATEAPATEAPATDPAATPPAEAAATEPATAPPADSAASAPEGTPGSARASAESAPPAPSDEPVPEVIGAIVYPPNRPQWVEDDPHTEGSGVHTIPVSSGPYTRHSDAIRALNAEIEKATNEYVTQHVGSQLAPTFLRYDARAIKHRFVQPDNIYEEEIVVSVGPMQQAHALIEFGPEFREELNRRWSQVRATSRLGQLGLFAGAGLLLLGSVFSYFRLDNATRGYYTGRLQFMAAAAILAVIGGSIFAARWITWL